MLPSLPSELWIEIFSLAVHVPGLFDTKWNYTPDEKLWEGGLARMTMTAESRHTRQSITQVSRAWWSMGRRFIFENISLSLEKPDRVAALATFIAEQRECRTAAVTTSGTEVDPEVQVDSSSSSTVTVASCGRWVKKITISGRELDKDIGFPALLHLLSACSNLHVVFFNVNTYDESVLPRLSQILQSRFTHSLRCMSIYTNRRNEYGGRIYTWRDLPNNVPLDSLALTVITDENMSDPFSPAPAAFSTLSTLEMNIPSLTTRLSFPSLSFPALRYLFLTGLENDYITPLLPFMQTNGPRLSGLRVWTRWTCSDLPALLTHTTILTSLVMDDMDLMTFQPSGNLKYPSVTHIGLTGVDYSYPRDINRVKNGLSYILSHNLFPSLQTVRILNVHDPDTLNQDWHQSIATAAQYGVRLEDFDRRILACKEPRLM